MYIQTDKVRVRQARMCVRKRVEGGRVEKLCQVEVDRYKAEFD